MDKIKSNLQYREHAPNRERSQNQITAAMASKVQKLTWNKDRKCISN